MTGRGEIWKMRQRIWIWHARITQSNFLATTKTRVNHVFCTLRSIFRVHHLLRTTIVASEINNLDPSVIWSAWAWGRIFRWVDDELSRYRDPMRRAIRAYNPSTFPTMMFSVPKAKGCSANRAFGHPSIGLPPRKSKFSTSSIMQSA